MPIVTTGQIQIEGDRLRTVTENIGTLEVCIAMTYNRDTRGIVHYETEVWKNRSECE